MYVALVGGCILLLAISNALGLTNIRVSLSAGMALIGVTTLLYIGMYATFRLANDHTP